MANVDEGSNLEIVGLDSLTNSGSCTCHATCGEYVAVGDVLRLVKCVVIVNGRTEDAVKLVNIQDATNSCTVAYVPRAATKLPKVTKNINRCAQVVTMYKDSTSSYKRRMSHQNKGMASIVFLDEFPVDE
jgi:hypothetical protein